MLKTIVWPAPTADIASSLHACTLLVVFRQEVLVRSVRVTPSLALVLALAAGAVFVRADGTPQALPFAQAWTDPTQIAANDIWTGVPGIQGFLGQDITTATGVDPQTLLTTSAVADDLDVSANQTNPNTFNTGGVAEFDGIANPTIALNGSGTADAPYILLALRTTGQSGIRVLYTLRDLDGSADNAVQPVALQFRVGATGPFIERAGRLRRGRDDRARAWPRSRRPVSVVLPAAADDQPELQVRIITTNAVGNDEWVGVDDISGDGRRRTAAADAVGERRQRGRGRRRRSRPRTSWCV